MSVILHTDPKTPPMSWEEFQKSKPPFSIALDGYVAAGPAYKLGPEPYLNFNHHEGCDRLATRATCGQVLMALKQGLVDCLRSEGAVQAHCWVNDCDEDVCMSWFLLRHWSMVEKTAYLKLTRLVNVTDTLDSTAGAYPYPKDLPILQDIAWVFDPYRQYRLSGKLDLKDSEGQREVIETVEDRILLHITGQGEQLPLDTSYKTLHKGSGWILCQEIGAQAKTGLWGDGVKAFVSFRERPGQPGVYTYTVGRLSPFVLQFDILRLFDILNQAEGLGPEARDRWGGANTIGGSPRISGSKLTPDEIIKIVEGALDTE